MLQNERDSRIDWCGCKTFRVCTHNNNVCNKRTSTVQIDSIHGIRFCFFHVVALIGGMETKYHSVVVYSRERPDPVSIDKSAFALDQSDYSKSLNSEFSVSPYTTYLHTIYSEYVLTVRTLTNRYKKRKKIDSRNKYMDKIYLFGYECAFDCAEAQVTLSHHHAWVYICTYMYLFQTHVLRHGPVNINGPCSPGYSYLYI